MESQRKLLGVNQAHKQGITGRAIGIAILDTGVTLVQDLTTPHQRVTAFVDLVHGEVGPYDDNGHGTHVAGICAGNGLLSNGKYCGIAPQSHVIGIKVLDEKGAGNSALVLAGLQWVMDHKEAYNIRIVNLSVGAEASGRGDPLIKAVNKLWDEGMVVVAAAGNNGPGAKTITSPGVSRKIITVGAVHDKLTQFSGRGPTSDCVIKPDLLAPGAKIISCLGKERQNMKAVDRYYMELSGTSMATPIVSGAVALLLERHPHLTPNQVKQALKESCTCLGLEKNQQGWGLLNIGGLVYGRG